VGEELGLEPEEAVLVGDDDRVPDLEGDLELVPDLEGVREPVGDLEGVAEGEGVAPPAVGDRVGVRVLLGVPEGEVLPVAPPLSMVVGVGGPPVGVAVGGLLVPLTEGEGVEVMDSVEEEDWEAPALKLGVGVAVRVGVGEAVAIWTLGHLLARQGSH
jgi:hypothetical protein